MAVTPTTHLEKSIAGAVQPVTHLEKVIAEYGGGGRGSITVDAELNENSTNPVQNKVIATMALQFLDALEGKADEETTVTVSGTTPTITPIRNRIYNCGELTSLTISNPTATGAYSVIFTSGSTATVTTFPASILGLEDFAAEANTIYEINVLDNRALVGSWAVSA